MIAAVPSVKQKQLVALNEHGRRVGQCHHNAKLTDADCDLIHALREEGMKLSAIAVKFGVKKAAVWKIVVGMRRNQTPDRWIEVEVPVTPAPRPVLAAPRKSYRKKEEPPPALNHAAVDLQAVINTCWR
jgi:hypothetical protein